MDWKLEKNPSFVLHTFHLICLAQEVLTHPAHEEIAMFCLHTFSLMYLALEVFFLPPRF